MDQLFQQVMSYVLGVWRRRWYVVLVAWLVAIPGWAYIYSMPDQYKASARVYVDTQSLLGPLLGGLTVTPRVDQQVDVVTRTLLSRPNLEEVARQSDLDLEAKDAKQMESLIGRLRAHLSLSGGNRENLYTISYTDDNPEVARKVVQALLNVFVESSLGSTRKDIASSRNFIDDQISQYEKKLDKMEERIKDFKQQHYGLLPGQGQNYYTQLKQAEDQLNQAKLSLQEAVSRRNSLKARLEGTEPVLLSDPDASSSTITTELDPRIDALQKKLDDLRTRYTENYPEVQQTQRILDDLRKQRKQIVASRRAKQAQSGGSQYDGNGNDYVQQMQYSLAQAESDVASLQARVSEYQQRYQKLKESVNKIPEVEAQYQELTRNHDVLKGNYEKLLATREKAELSGNVESKTKGVEFRVVDPPFVPSQPSGPNRMMFSSAILLVALGAGAGLAFVLSQIWRVVDGRQSLARLTSRPCVGTVSYVPLPQARHRQLMHLIGFGACALALFGVYGVLTVYYAVVV